MAAKDGFEKFQSSLLKAVQDDMLPRLKGEWKALSEVVNNHIFNLSGPKSLNSRRTGRQTHIYKIFYGFIEILRSLETLSEIGFYVGKFPYRSTTASRDRYLQFLVEAYLHEIYVMDQRLRRFLRTIERQYRRDIRLSEIRLACKRLSKLVTASLQNIVRMRSTHVHEARISDADIDRLSSMALLMHSSDQAFANAMKSLYRVESQKVQRIWVKRVSANNLYIRRVLDVYFGHLLQVVFDDKGEMVYPSRLKF